MKTIIKISLFLLPVLIISSCGKKNTETDQPKQVLVVTLSHIDQTDHLMECGDVWERISHSKGWKVLDVRKPEEFAKGHLPGAIQVYRPDYGSSNFGYKGMRAERKELELLFSKKGILPTDTLVLYDADGDVDAARLWWLITQHGHKNVVMLHGGLTCWSMKEMPVTTEVAKLPVSNYVFPHDFDHSITAEKEDVLAAIGDTNYVIVDARSLEEYTGEYIKDGALKGGHIPGSIHEDYIYSLNYDGNYNFRDLSELKQRFEAKGITPDKKIITYCHTGVRSALSLFVLKELLHYPHVQNYDGSWVEWTHFDDLPIEKTDSVKENYKL